MSSSPAGATPGRPPGEEPVVGSAFQVDLRGVVDLLARHLYSGPRVYVRELLQNAVDAITARQELDPSAPATVRIRSIAGGGIEVADTGIGLTFAQAGELLATVGRSSKRDIELGVGREQFLGQFGIGLLSAFMVADRIELVSRSAADPSAPAVRWVGHSDGRYDLQTIADDVPAGSVVRLLPRRDSEHWLEPETVLALATEFGSLLPVDVAVEVPLTADELVWRRVSLPELPWSAADVTPATLRRFCEQTLGFTPLAQIPLEVPLAGISGVAFVLPTAVGPGSAANHRVYLKQMLLGSSVEGLLPDWTFFVRCVINATALRPTASREQLYEDEMLTIARDELAAAIRSWTVSTLSEPSRTATEFITTHHLAVRSLATTDDEMLRLAARVLPYETTDGLLTLAEVAEQHGEVVYCATTEEFRRIAPVARAQGLAVVNGGYVYDADLLARLAVQQQDWNVRELGAGDVARVLSTIDPSDELRWLDAVAAGDAALEQQDCSIVLRSFEPMELPAMLLHDRDGDHQREAARTASESDDLWGGVLAGFVTTPRSRDLVLNCSNPVVGDLLDAPAGPVRDAGFQSLYVSALLMAGEPLRARDSELMTAALTVLLRAGITPPAPPTTKD